MSLIPIREQSDLKQIELLKSGIVEESAHFERAWLRKEQWTVVPAESSSHFNETGASRLEHAFRIFRCPAVFALATEPELVGPGWPDPMSELSVRAFLLDTSKKDLLDFSSVCGSFNFLLIPGNRSVAVMCTVHDYYLVGGPLEFVKAAVGGSVEGAWQRFKDFARGQTREEWYWKNVVERYSEIGWDA